MTPMAGRSSRRPRSQLGGLSRIIRSNHITGIGGEMNNTRAKVARLLRTEGEYTSDLMEPAARLDASPRSTRRSTAAASRRAKNAARSAASRLAIRRLGGWPGGGRGAGTWPRFFDGGGGMVAVATGEGGVLGVLVLRCGGLGNLGEKWRHELHLHLLLQPRSPQTLALSPLLLAGGERRRRAAGPGAPSSASSSSRP
uniref:Uncharacterized protein n=1 Tax=Oryza glumipatula TaxID=40148 RepID=A0A0D9YPC3_9ORYZ